MLYFLILTISERKFRSKIRFVCPLEAAKNMKDRVDLVRLYIKIL